MLELEDKIFGTSVNKEAKGYAKVEIKNDQGTLVINCQNLNSSNNGNRYRWYLINTKKEEEPSIVEVGPMEIDEKGKGEVVWEFNTENVRGSMQQIDDFDVLVLAVQNKEDKRKLFVPLVGYIDKEKPSSWRYALERYLYIPLSKENIVEEKTLAPKLIEQIETIEEPIIVSTDVDEDTNENVDIVEEIKEDIKEEISETQTKVHNFIEDVSKENIDEVKEESTDKVKEEHLEEHEEHIDEAKEKHEEEITMKLDVEEKDNIFEEEKDEFQTQMQRYIENSLKNFPKVEPFDNNLEHYVWWQIPYCHQTMYRSYMPFIPYLDSLKQSTDYNVSKNIQTVYVHQHHIFGICYDQNNIAKYYAYGIPGRNLPWDQPYETSVDLTYWQPCNNVPFNIESYGYWILRIDPKTGDTIKHIQL